MTNDVSQPPSEHGWTPDWDGLSVKTAQHLINKSNR